MRAAERAKAATAGGGDARGVACSGEVESLVTFEPAHFRGHRVAFALDRRDGAIGVRGGGEARGVACLGEVESW